MGKVCCVKSCPYNKAKEFRPVPDKDRPMLHRFPSNEVTRQIWISKCDFTGKYTNDTRICSLHFISEDYEQKAKRLELTKHAVPTRDLPIPAAPANAYHRVILPKALQHDSIPSDYEVALSEKLTILLSFDERFSQGENNFNIPGFKVVDKEKNQLKEKLDNEEKWRHQLQNEVREFRKRNEELKEKLSKVQSSNKRNISDKNYWRKQNSHRMKKLSEMRLILKQRSKRDPSDEKLLTAVSKIFSPAQIRALKSDTGRVKWDPDDIAKAIAIRSRSSNCYNFYREFLHFPLPDRSTLSRWTSSIVFKPGLQEDILKLLKHQLQCLPLLCKLAAICFDEMSLDSRLQYDPSSDSVLGFCSTMMVVMLRGIADSWKQPIYFTFEKDFNGTILKQIICAVEEAGIHVVSVTCDMAGGNRGIAKELGITEEKTYFSNPFNSKKVFWFYDAPHLLKLLRNHILDDGLVLSCGKTLQKKDFEKLLKLDCRDYKVCYKLTSAHLTVEGRERQRVYYATQLISRSTALAMRMLCEDKKEVADFIELMNDWFDIFNSRHPKDPVRKPFGIDLDNQLRTLDLAYKEISAFRPIGKSKLPFQSGMLINISSLKGVYEELSGEPVRAVYVITKSFNQDCLENCFSVVRATGRYHDTPNAYEAMCRLKTVMLGWNFRENSTFVSTSMEESQPTTFLSTMLLGSLRSTPLQNENEESVNDESSPEDYVPDKSLDEDNWYAFYNSLDSTEKCEFGGKEYIYGFIAKKLKKKFPNLTLGVTRYVEREPKSWIQLKSRGGLTIPSYDWVNACERMDKVFVEYHTRDGLLHINQKPGAIRGLTKKMFNIFPDIPEPAVRLFVRTRTFIRINHINDQIVAARSRKKNKRKSAQFAKSGMRLRSHGHGAEVSQVNQEDEERIAA